MVSLPAFPHQYQQGIAPWRDHLLQQAARSGARSPVLMPLVPAHPQPHHQGLFCPGKVQGLFFLLVKFKASSPTLLLPKPALLPATSCNGWVGWVGREVGRAYFHPPLPLYFCSRTLRMSSPVHIAALPIPFPQHHQQGQLYWNITNFVTFETVNIQFKMVTRIA